MSRTIPLGARFSRLNPSRWRDRYLSHDSQPKALRPWYGDQTRLIIRISIIQLF
jgi:hypothetical protein